MTIILHRSAYPTEATAGIAPPSALLLSTLATGGVCSGVISEPFDLRGVFSTQSVTSPFLQYLGVSAPYSYAGPAMFGGSPSVDNEVPTTSSYQFNSTIWSLSSCSVDALGRIPLTAGINTNGGAAIDRNHFCSLGSTDQTAMSLVSRFV